MAVNTKSFLVLYEEFSNTPKAKIDAAITHAEKRTNADTWGDLVDTAIMLRAAHILATAPTGENARLSVQDRRETIYQQELDRMIVEVTAGLGRMA